MAEAPPARRLLNATAVMASGTMASRVLGMVRATMVAIVLGNAGAQVDVFNYATVVPNSLYLLIAGGTLNNVLVPQIVRAVRHDEDAGKAFINRIMTAFLLALGTLTVVCTAAVPLVMSLYTAGSWREPAMAAHWQALLLMSYITMPQLFFFGVFFLIGQVLNARDVFGPMMWAPIANNVVSIIVFGAYLATWGTAPTGNPQPFNVSQAVLLAVGSTVGIIIQTVILLPYLRKAGVNYRPRFDLKGAGLGRTFHVAKWMVGFVALTSLAQLVTFNLASSAAPNGQAGAAGLTAYQNAYLIWILPHSLLTVSLATAMLPAASRAAVSGNLRGATEQVMWALRHATTLIVPASLGLIVLADPITRLVYGHGAGADDYHLVAWTLMAFAVGLVPYTIQYLYLRAFYALDNTLTPFLLQIVISGANALLAVTLVLAVRNPSTVAAMLALSYSLAYFVGCYLTHRALSRRVPGLDGRAILRHLVRLLLASLPAVMLAFGIGWFASGYESLLIRVGALILAAGLAIVAFFFTARRLHITEVGELTALLRRRPAGPESDPAQPAAELDHDQPQVETSDAATGEDLVEVTPASPPEAALDYPPVTERAIDPGDEPTNLIDVGRMLAGRYRLADLLAERNGHQTWRAEDTVLTRPVLIVLLAEDDPRAGQVLELARRAALATDSRFLRVLDVVNASPGEHGVYLVYEYASGQTLQRILASGPLTGAETAWVVREVSDALIGLHANGLHHRHLSPATVLVTTTGNIKILGLLVDEVLSGTGQGEADGQAADVRALGRLLYAALVARWPGESRHGLPGVQPQAGGIPLPSQVRSGVAHPVDVVVDRILSEQPRQHASRLLTAADVTTELSLVLGPTSAAADLRVRLDRPDPGSPPVSVVVPPVPTPARPRFEVSEPVSSPEPLPASSLDEPTPAPFTPVPPPASAASPSPSVPTARRPLSLRWWILIAVALVVIVLAALALSRQPSQESAPPPAGPTPVARAIAAVTDFDPRADGGSGQENPKQVGRVNDNDPKTVWQTERYRKLPNLGGLKPGVGLVLDLGSAVVVREVVVGLANGPTAFEVRVPAQPAAEAPMESQSQWRQVARVASGTGQVRLGFPAETTRYVLVYLTELPAVADGYFRGTVAEAEVLG